MDAMSFIFNYKTKEYEPFESSEDSFRDWADYIPQDESAQALYELYQQVDGLPPLLAAKEVLKRCIGEK